MELLDGEESFQRPCCSKCEDCKDFQKIADIKEAGLLIYRHLIKNNDVKNSEKLATAIDPTKDVLIIHNRRNVKITSADFMPTLESIQISCQRCKAIFERVRRFLKDVPIISENNILGICHQCYLKQFQICYDCKNIVKKFVEVRSREKSCKDAVKICCTHVNDVFGDVSNGEVKNTKVTSAAGHVVKTLNRSEPNIPALLLKIQGIENRIFISERSMSDSYISDSLHSIEHAKHRNIEEETYINISKLNRSDFNIPGSLFYTPKATKRENVKERLHAFNKRIYVLSPTKSQENVYIRQKHLARQIFYPEHKYPTSQEKPGIQSVAEVNKIQSLFGEGLLKTPVKNQYHNILESYTHKSNFVMNKTNKDHQPNFCKSQDFLGSHVNEDQQIISKVDLKYSPDGNQPYVSEAHERHKYEKKEKSLYQTKLKSRTVHIKSDHEPLKMLIINKENKIIPKDVGSFMHEKQKEVNNNNTNNQQQHSAETLISFISRAAQNSFETELSYFFPSKSIQRKSPQKLKVQSSAALIEETKKRIKENKIRKEIEKKSEMERKTKFAEEKAIIVAEKHRLAEEKRKIAEEEKKLRRLEEEKRKAKEALENKHIKEEKEKLNKIKSLVKSNEKEILNDIKTKKDNIENDLIPSKTKDRIKKYVSLIALEKKSNETNVAGKDKKLAKDFLRKELMYKQDDKQKSKKGFGENTLKEKEKLKKENEDKLHKEKEVKGRKEGEAKLQKESKEKLRKEKINTLQKDKEDMGKTKKGKEEILHYEEEKVKDLMLKGKNQKTTKDKSEKSVKSNGSNTPLGPYKTDTLKDLKIMEFKDKENTKLEDGPENKQETKNIDKIEKTMMKNKEEKKTVLLNKELRSKNEKDQLLQQKEDHREQSEENQITVIQVLKKLNQSEKDQYPDTKQQKLLEAERKEIHDTADKKVAYNANQKINVVHKPVKTQLKSELQTSKIDDKPHKESEQPEMKELKLNQIKVRRPSADDLILQLVRMRQVASLPRNERRAGHVDPSTILAHRHHQYLKLRDCIVCEDSDLELAIESIEFEHTRQILSDVIIGEHIFKHIPLCLARKNKVKDIVPLLFQSVIDLHTTPMLKEREEVIQATPKDIGEHPLSTGKSVKAASILTT